MRIFAISRLFQNALAFKLHLEIFSVITDSMYLINKPKMAYSRDLPKMAVIDYPGWTGWHGVAGMD